jgi:hypothetical protein
MSKLECPPLLAEGQAFPHGGDNLPKITRELIPAVRGGATRALVNSGPFCNEPAMKVVPQVFIPGAQKFNSISTKLSQLGTDHRNVGMTIRYRALRCADPVKQVAKDC